MDTNPDQRTAEQAMDARLDQAGLTIDRLLARARAFPDAVSSQLAWKVDALRAREARIRGRLRAVRLEPGSTPR